MHKPKRTGKKEAYTILCSISNILKLGSQTEITTFLKNNFKASAKY